MELHPVFRKIFESPVLPVRGTWVDAVIFIVFFLLLSLSVFFLRQSKARQIARTIIRTISIFVIGYVFFARMCLIKTSPSSISKIGWDDISVFGNFYIFILVAAFVLIMGNIYCGWLCPLGFLQEIARRIFFIKSKKVKFIFWAAVSAVALILLYIFRPANDFFTENIIALWSLGLLVIIPLLLLNPKIDSYLKDIRYGSLFLYILITAAGVLFGDAWCWLAEGELDYSSLIGFLVIFLAAAIIPFAWCRYLCPTGTFLSMLNKRSLLKIKSGCKSDCNKSCEEICPIGAKIRGKLDSSLCSLCGRCFSQCGSQYPNDEKN